MASIIPDYEYDIFISYRQKDNKGEKWVSEFVESLKTELESTFKENVSVYFDINPYDGLLETYDVNDSLRRKLKCLVFIPIISRTYCDQNSFAWEHEFKAFIEQSAKDQFGLKINLPNGNVISRILPIRIHELDPVDLKLCESVLGGMLRSIDFVYKTPGVNRPLRSTEERPQDNINKTYYRDQINKVSNSIRDIINGLTYSSQPKAVAVPEKKIRIEVRKPEKKRLGKSMLAMAGVLLIIIICGAGIFLFSKANKNNISEKTITIIPSTNPANDPVLSTSAIGSMDAIITKLQEIKSITVRSRFTSLQYLDTKKPLDELRKELNSNYLVVINLSRSGNNMILWIGLSETKNDNQLWADKYVWNEEQLMPLFTKVVQTIAGKLNINFSNQEVASIEKDLTEKPEAYLNYLTASAGLISAMGNKFLDTTSFRTAINFYDKAIEKDPEFASAYARRAIALSWGIHTGELPVSLVKKCWSDIENASRINSDLADIQIARGFYHYYITKDYANAITSFNIAAEKDPGSYLPLFYMAMVYKAMGNWNKVQSLLNKVVRFNLQDPLVLTNIGLCYEYLHKFDSALIYHQKAINVNQDWGAAYQNKLGTILLKYPDTSEAHKFLNQTSSNSTDKFVEDQITLDLYDGKYFDALTKAKKSNSDDFRYKGSRFIYLGNISLLLNDKPAADKYYEEALSLLKIDLKADTVDARIHGLIGLALAGQGKNEAVKNGKNALRIARKQNDKLLETEIILNLAEIYARLGNSKEAIENIEIVLKSPSLFSTKILKFDPVWKPLMSSPEFETLISKYDK